MPATTLESRNKSAAAVRHPFLAFAALAYAWSWTFWLLAPLLPDSVAPAAHYAGAFGPFVAAAIIVGAQGRSISAWILGLLKWRVHPLWYLFVLGFPVLLVASLSAAVSLSGGGVDLGLLTERLPALLPTFLLMMVIGGGNEEPGWRGLGLPALQRDLSPLKSTLVLGFVWALWHLPLLLANPDVASGAIGAGEVAFIAVVTLASIVLHAFWYTWLLNRTGSVLLCVLLHAAYNTANGLLLPISDEAMRGDAYRWLLLVMTLILAASVAGLIVSTRGRLGAPSIHDNSSTGLSAQ